MQRPPSIMLFERLYLGSLALYLIGTVAFWSRTQAVIMSMPQLQANPAFGSFVSVIMAGSIAITAAVAVLFWWLVARRRSATGKWLVVVTEALGCLFALFSILSLARGTTPNPTGTIINLIATALAVVAAVVLFRPDAKAWFGEVVAPGNPY